MEIYWQLSFNGNTLNYVGKKGISKHSLHKLQETKALWRVHAIRVRRFNLFRVDHFNVLDGECKLHSYSSCNFLHHPLKYPPLEANVRNYLIKASLSCSQEPAISSYPKPDESNPYDPLYSFKVIFNTILPYTSRSS
jgi:hypothetical protein